MAKPFPKLLILSAVLAGFASPAASQATQSERVCKKNVARMGVPHRIKTVAQINAVRAWTEGSHKHGADYAMWHNAWRDSVTCEKLPRSDYYRCMAAGRPCLPASKRAAQANE